MTAAIALPFRRGRFIQVELADLTDPFIDAAEPYDRRSAWVDLLQRAAWRAGEGLRRGQLRTTHQALAQAWRWTAGKVQRFLEGLAARGKIELATEGAGRAIHTVITVRAIAGADVRTDVQPMDNAHEASRCNVERSVPIAIAREVAIDGQVDETKESRPGVEVDEGLEPRVASARESNSRGTPTAKGELLAFTEALVRGLNWAQRELNGRVDKDTLRPLYVDDRKGKNAAAAAAIMRAGVPLEFALAYVRSQAAKYKPKPGKPQIGSLAYLQRGMIGEWHQLQLPRPIAAEPTRPARVLPPAPRIPADAVPAAPERGTVQKTGWPSTLHDTLAKLLEGSPILLEA